MSNAISHLPGRVLVRLGRRIRKPLDNVLARQSAVGDPAVFARDTFPEVVAVEQHWKVIRDEARAVMEGQGLTPPA